MCCRVAIGELSTHICTNLTERLVRLIVEHCVFSVTNFNGTRNFREAASIHKMVTVHKFDSFNASETPKKSWLNAEKI